MKGLADETVGDDFRLDHLHLASQKTADIMYHVAAQAQPGVTAHQLIDFLKTQLNEWGAEGQWHAPQVRLGADTLLSFGEKGEEPPLSDNDIFFLDFGLIINGHEGDVGRTFYLGSDPEMQRCCRDVESIWQEVKEYWRKSENTGDKLYEFAHMCAQKRGWVLNKKKANGHRIADFPHAARARGSIENFSGRPQPNRWVLEIQIRHPARPFGGFYEDLLN